MFSDELEEKCSLCYSKLLDKSIKCENCSSLKLNYCNEICRNKHNHDCQPDQIQHLNKMMLKNDDDVIIIYSKFEYLYPINNKYNGWYVPQWVSTDVVSKTRGIHLPLNSGVICQNHRQMKDLALFRITKAVSFKPRNVYFYYANGKFKMNNTDPFQTNVYQVFDEKMVKSCNFCLKYEENSMMKCGKCQIKYYCDQQCQRKDWVKHKLSCK